MNYFWYHQALNLLTKETIPEKAFPSLYGLIDFGMDLSLCCYLTNQNSFFNI